MSSAEERRGERAPEAAPDRGAAASRTGPLRLAMVGTAPPLRGGLAQFNVALCRQLAQKHDVSLFTFTRQYPGLLFPGKTQLDTSDTPFTYPAEATVDSIGPWSWFRTAERVARLSPQGLIFKYWMPFFAPAFGTILRGVKRRCPAVRTVVILDNVIPHERRPFDVTLTRYFLGQVDGFIAMSRSVADDLHSFYPAAECRFVPHPVYDLFGERIPKAEARQVLGLPENEPCLLFFGFIRDYKGLDVLLDALPEVRRHLPVRLLVLGEFYADKEKTMQQIARLGLEDAVDLQDAYVPNERVGLYFSAADAVVLPYRSATQSGIVPIAYQLERPVICTDVGGLSEVVLPERTGIVVPPAQPAALAAAILRFYRDALEAPFVEAVKREREKYSWNRMAEAVEELVSKPTRKGKAE